MDVGVLVFRRVEVHDAVDTPDMQAAGGYVRADKHLGTPSRNIARAWSRWDWVRSPWIGTATMPAWVS